MDLRNTALRQEEIQRMQLVEECLKRIESPIFNENCSDENIRKDNGKQNAINPTRVNASGSIQVNVGSPNQVQVRIPEAQGSGSKLQSQLAKDNRDGGDQNRDVVPRTQNPPGT